MTIYNLDVLLSQFGTSLLLQVVDISPCSLDSSLQIIQPGISHEVLCI